MLDNTVLAKDEQLMAVSVGPGSKVEMELDVIEPNSIIKYAMTFWLSKGSNVNQHVFI